MKPWRTSQWQAMFQPSGVLTDHTNRFPKRRCNCCPSHSPPPPPSRPAPPRPRSITRASLYKLQRFQVAEAVLVTPKNPASPPGQWKANHMQQAAAMTGSSTGAGAAWCGPTLTSGTMLTSPLSGMLEKDPLGYHGERSQVSPPSPPPLIY